MRATSRTRSRHIVGAEKRARWQRVYYVVNSHRSHHSTGPLRRAGGDTQNQQADGCGFDWPPGWLSSTCFVTDSLSAGLALASTCFVTDSIGRRVGSCQAVSFECLCQECSAIRPVAQACNAQASSGVLAGQSHLNARAGSPMEVDATRSVA